MSKMSGIRISCISTFLKMNNFLVKFCEKKSCCAYVIFDEILCHNTKVMNGSLEAATSQLQSGLSSSSGSTAQTSTNLRSISSSIELPVQQEAKYPSIVHFEDAKGETSQVHKETEELNAKAVKVLHTPVVAVFEHRLSRQIQKATANKAKERAERFKSLYLGNAQHAHVQSGQLRPVRLQSESDSVLGSGSSEQPDSTGAGDHESGGDGRVRGEEQQSVPDEDLSALRDLLRVKPMLLQALLSDGKVGGSSSRRQQPGDSHSSGRDTVRSRDSGNGHQRQPVRRTISGSRVQYSEGDKVAETHEHRQPASHVQNVSQLPESARLRK